MKLSPTLLCGLLCVAATHCLAAERRPEPLDRGLVAVPAGSNSVHVSWRFLESDAPATAFVLEHWTPDTQGIPRRLTAEPLHATTSFLHQPASASEAHSYRLIQLDAAGNPQAGHSVEVHLPAHPKPYRSTPLQGDHGIQKVALADLNGDGALDFVVKLPDANVDPYVQYWKRSTEPFTLEAYDSSGRFLWQHNLGWSIERGVWYSPYVVFDLDGDGRAEVAVKTGEGDPRDPDGKVTTGPEHLTLLDGLTGNAVTRTDWPSRDLFAGQRDPYNYASRNQLAIAFLNGRTPSLIVERGTYNVIVVVAYDLVNGVLQERWRWDNRNESKTYWGQGAHSLHAADVDADGRDELIIGSAVIDDDGTSLWSTGLGHPDHAYVGDLDPTRDGLEIYYGIESRQKESNGMCMVDARTGRILWGYDGPTRHVHSQGLCSDIDARHPGAESYSADTDEEKKPAWARLWTANGQVLSEELKWSFGPTAVYWDADPQREVLWKGRLSSYDSGEPHESRIEGKVVAVADILGDWREEILVSVNGELRIYSTPIPATDRRPCLMQDPLYRNEVAVSPMGYFQVPLLSYDMASRAAGDE